MTKPAPETGAGSAPEFRSQMGKGRTPGSLNKTTKLLKDAILMAAEQAGGKAGLVGYLAEQAVANPQSFLPLLGKVLPMQITGEDGGALTVKIVKP